MRDLRTLLMLGVILAGTERSAILATPSSLTCFDLPLAHSNCCTKWQNNEVEVQRALEFHGFAQHRLLISSRIECRSETVGGQMPFGVGTNAAPWFSSRRYLQRAFTPTTLKILFHRNRGSTTWAYLLVLHGIGFD